MKIQYTENPLNTIIELEDNERKMLYAKLYDEELDRLHYEFEVDAALDENAKRINIFDVAYTVKNLLNECEQALKGSHCGDCICVPCSCNKCLAEQFLGIDTIAGLSEHGAHKIAAAFRAKQSIHEAITELETYSQEKFEEWSHPGDKGRRERSLRWRVEAGRAAAWLCAYRDRHFPKELISKQ